MKIYILFLDLPGSSLIQEKIDKYVGIDLVKILMKNKEFELSIEDQQNIFLSKAGGGSPAHTFLQFLQIRKWDESMDQLKECLKKYPMFSNALRIVEKYEDHDFIGNITTNHISELSTALTAIGGVVHDWKIVADYFDLQDIKDICEKAVARENIYNRCQTLFGIIEVRYPKFTIEKFIDAYKEFPGIVHFIKKQIQEKAERNLRRKSDLR